MEEILSVQGLGKAYPGFALEDVCFSVAPGQIMGLIGRNGAEIKYKEKQGESRGFPAFP